MKSLELKPTYENLLNTLIEDTIGRNQDIRMFADIINSLEDSCAIALDGSWGSGKTFFVKQTKMLIDSHNPFIQSINEEDREAIKTACRFRREMEYEPQVTVYYDAWENDEDSEPVLSLVYSIVNSIGVDYASSNDTTFVQKAAAVLEFFTDKNWQEVIESFKGKSPLEEIKKNKDIQNEIKAFLDDLLSERGDRLVIFIDELDRCNPSYAVKLLERIKHYFDNDRITFVFSINTIELQHTIKKHYGENFDACRYLDRFFDLKVAVPEYDFSKIYSSIDFHNSGYVFDKMCDKVMRKYNFSIREMSKYIRLTKIAAFEPTHDRNKYDFSFPEGKGLQFGLFYIVPIMIGLNVCNRDLYEEFIGGRNYKPLIDLLLDEEPYFFRNLLENDETFDEAEITDENRGKIKLVSLEDKIIKIYNALFSLNNNKDTKIGGYYFDRTVKSTLIKTVSLLSNYASPHFKTDD